MKTENENKIEYKHHNKVYIAVKEVNKGCCKGCAFINDLSCYKHQDRLDICQKGYIFMVKLNK